MEGCVPKCKPDCAPGNVVEDCFGQTHDGRDVTRYTLKNPNGIVLQVINYGATITAIKLPLKSGPLDIVLGFDDMKGYLSPKNSYFGATVGRITNRTRPTKFKLRNECISLTANYGRDTHLHGGCTGFSKVLWDSEVNGNLVVMKYKSRDLEEGVPGNLEVTATFSVTDTDGVFVKYQAKTDKLTLVNITSHPYFNLAGHNAGPRALLDHHLSIEGDTYLGLCEQVPTGEVLAVEGTGYDFREPRLIGEALSKLKDEDGFDVNYCLRPPESCLRLAAKACYKPKCVIMELYANGPGLQFYSGNGLKDVCGKEKAMYKKYGAICLEPQGFPNAANVKTFPTIELEPGEEFFKGMLFNFKFPGVGSK